MTQPYFLQMRIQPPDLVLNLIKIYTQNLSKQNSQFTSDLIEMELILARHSQKLDSIQQMKKDKSLKQNILWQLQLKQLTKKFPSILHSQKQKDLSSRQRHEDEQQNKSFHLRTLKKNSHSTFKKLDKLKPGQNINQKNKASQKKDQISKEQKNKQTDFQQKENNYIVFLKSPYYKKQLDLNKSKNLNKIQSFQMSNKKHLRKSSSQLIFHQKQQQINKNPSNQSPTKNIEKIRLSKQNSNKNESFLFNKTKEDGEGFNNPYHHSKFKKELDNYKLIFDKIPSSKRGKVIELRQSLY